MPSSRKKVLQPSRIACLPLQSACSGSPEIETYLKTPKLTEMKVGTFTKLINKKIRGKR